MTFALIALIVVGCSGGDEPRQPNILLLYLDDLGFNDLGVYGSREADTPNLDAFAQQGVVFKRHYADSTCSPSRAALLTGMFPARLGYAPDGPGISPQTPTLPKELARLGYTTHHVGKWHLGHISPLAWPDAVGFDTWFGFLSQWLMRGPYEHPHREDSYASPTYIDPWLDGHDRSPQQYKGHLSDILAEHTKKLIREGSRQDQPWFINHWFYLPHTPIQPAPRYAEKFEDTGRGRSLAMLAQLDDTIAGLLAVLEETGQSSNTIVIIAGDNGGANIHRDNNWPYFGKKADFLEGGIRTPMIIRWPGVVPARSVIDHPTSVTDLMPTIIRAANGEPPEKIDGFDLMPLIVDGKKPPARTLYWEAQIRDQYSLGVLSEDGRWRLSSYFLNWPHEHGWVLNDLEADPSGTVNSAEEYPEIAQALLEQYKNWFRDAHSLELRYTKGDQPSYAMVTGDDLQRSPWFGPFTFAIALHSQTGEMGGAEKIVFQEGVWDMELHSGKRQLRLRVGDYDLGGQLGDGSQCQSVVFAGDFHRRVTNWQGNDNRLVARLYVNGILSDTLEAEGFLDVVDGLPNPTVIGSAPDGGMAFKGKLGQPMFFNVMASEKNYLSPADLHKELCDETSIQIPLTR